MERAVTRRALIAGAAVSGVGVLYPPGVAARRWPRVAAYGGGVAFEWYDLALELVRTTPGFSPPVAARAFGYMGVALHEALAPGLPGGRGFGGQLTGLGALPRPRDLTYHWPTVASSSLAGIVRSLFPTATTEAVAAIDALVRRQSARPRARLPRRVFERSVRRGTVVAAHVFDWSRGDGGHEGFRRNFPPYTPPSGPGLWQPTPPGYLPALQPAWGANRPFALPSAAACDPGPPLPYSEEPGSAFHEEARECHVVVQRLSAEQTAVARFWSDDPGQTPTPAGHSISILTQVARRRRLDLARVADAYGRVGIAVADAFISCWEAKYRYNLLRPVTYVRSEIDQGFTPLLVTPPFPEYTSGHSVQSAAAAHVLQARLGKVAFTDRTHRARGLPSRSFRSFTEAAQEAAVSRLYGGIHFRRAIDLGLSQGARVGAFALALE